ncbi:beta family protein [Actinokineospora sp. PR83]|uniref:beta family protein n=1 Tax=Actinokineospora sp. PR83 TaxID=2884908 RepID=UPI001F3505F7|nr:beta family protein [Actinokineospora sp. PR83]MCG8918411.1 beta family protein [Actinokineospora sp. PR83]
MTIRPLAALKSKVGELEAIGHLPAGDSPRARVLLELTDRVRVTDRAKVFPALVEAAASMAAAGEPLWVDGHLVGADGPLARQPGGVLQFLDREVEDRLGLWGEDRPALIPVVRDHASPEELRTVALLREHRSRDVVVRIGQNAPIAELAGRLRDITRRIGDQSGALHAVIDLGFLDPPSRERVDRVAGLAEWLVARFGPGSTTLLAGSIPASRSGYATTVRERPEAALWQVVNDRVEIGYGDYGVAHPVAQPLSGSVATIPNPYLFYTVPGRTLALRRQVPKADRLSQSNALGRAFTDIAEELVSRSDFAGSHYSWGDEQLDRCRTSDGRGFGSATRWVEIATSHHLAHLARRSADW